MQKPIATLMFLCLSSIAAAQNEAALKLVQTISLPDVDGRIDHFSIDVKGRRVFLAALAKNTIEVVDLSAGQVIHTLQDFAKPQGVRFVAGLNKLFVASGTDGTLKTLDGTTLSLLRTDHVSLGADAIGYDSRSKYLFVGSGGVDAGKEPGDLTVFNARTGAQIAAIVTDAHAGGSVVEEQGPHLFVLFPEKAEVVVLDRKSLNVEAKWTVPGIQKNVAVDLDEKNHRLFLGVRTPASVVVLDSRSGAVIASIPTVGTLDGLSYDPTNRRIYTSGGEGFVQGRIDHFTIDAKRKRVIFSGLGNNSVEVVDVFAGRVIHQIDGLSEPQGALYLAEWDKLFVANSADGHVNVYDG